MKYILLSLVNFIFIAAFSQDTASKSFITVKPGDGVVDGSFITAYKNAWSMIAQRQGLKERNIGTWGDETKLITKDGKKEIVRTQLSVSITGWDKYVNVVDATTFEPISSEYTDAKGRSNSAVYLGNKVTWKHTDVNGKTEEKEIVLTERVYDFVGGMYGMTLVAFPLKEGYAAQFPTFNPLTGKQEWVKFFVEGEETVQAGPNKQVKAWVVKTTPDPTDGSYERFSISKDAPYVIQLIEFSRPKMTFTML